MSKSNDKEVIQMAAKMGLLASLYAVTSVVPVSIFIGASSLLTLNLIITPLIAILLPPLNAVATAIIGGLLALWIAPAQAIFGPTTLFLPIAGAFFGSLLFYKSKLGSIASSGFLLVIITLYLMARQTFPYWIFPHLLAASFAFFMLFLKSLRKKIFVTVYVSTMCEQAAMLLQAVYILQLPAEVFMSAFPLMLYERLIATVGSFLLIESLRQLWPQSIFP